MFIYTVCPQSPLGVLENCVLCSTLCIIERGSNNSREARRVDFLGLRTNDARIVPTHSSLTPGLPLSCDHGRYQFLGNA
jgi:hypothetical protein